MRRLGLLLIAVAFASTLPTRAQDTFSSAAPTLPTALEKYRGVHPRLFLDKPAVDALRLRTRTTHHALWLAFLTVANKIAASPPEPYRPDKGEQLWQRNVGNDIATLAFAYLITHDKKYLARAVADATASCHYPTWGTDPQTGAPAAQGLAYGHQMLGLAMLYDYAFDVLDTATKQMIRQTLVDKATIEYPAFKARYALLQNHTWIKSTGLLATGLALFDEEPSAAAWIALPEQILAQSDRMLSPDGATQEGFGYWQYGVEYLFKLSALSKIFGGDELTSANWGKTDDFALQMMLPRHAWTWPDSQNDYCDSARSTWYGPDYLLRALAARNRDGTAQWLADRIDEAHVEAPLAPWLNLLWYDPTVAPVPPDAKPTLQRFDNMGLVCARTDWSGDESELFFKAGNPLGKFAPDNFAAALDPWDLGHVHHDANHFSLFGAGEWLLRNPGYGNRDSRFHNTLVVDRQGQWGDNKTTPWPLRPGQDFAHIAEATSTPALDRITGEAAGAYPPPTGVKKFTRHLLFLKPDALIVADDIELDQPRQLELFFHPEQEPVPQPGGWYRAQGHQAILRLDLLTPEGATPAVISQQLPPSHGKPGGKIRAIAVRKMAASWRNAVALSWSAAGAEPVVVTLQKNGATWTFTAGNRAAVLDWNAPSPKNETPSAGMTDREKPLASQP